MLLGAGVMAVNALSARGAAQAKGVAQAKGAAFFAPQLVIWERRGGVIKDSGFGVVPAVWLGSAEFGLRFFISVSNIKRGFLEACMEFIWIVFSAVVVVAVYTTLKTNRQ